MAEMTLSQALRRVKKIKGELAEQLERARGSVTFKNTEQPAYVFGECMERVTSLRTELLDLQARIAKTNAVNVLPYNGQALTLAYAVLLLKEYKGQIAWLNELKAIVRSQETTSQEETEYDYDSEKRLRKQVNYTCRLPEAKRSAQVDSVKADFDRLNELVESMNHRVTLKND